jgi:hypothetical protein
MTGREFTADDLARFLALEHMTVTLWSAYLAGQADARETPAATVARQFGDALHGSIVDSAWSPEVQGLMRDHVRRVFGQVVTNCETMDRLAGG